MELAILIMVILVILCLIYLLIKFEDLKQTVEVLRLVTKANTMENLELINDVNELKTRISLLEGDKWK